MMGRSHGAALAGAMACWCALTGAARAESAVILQQQRPVFVHPSDEPLVRQEPRTLEVGAGLPLQLPSKAVRLAHPGDTIRIRPGRYEDCFTVTKKRVTIEGMGRPEEVVITGPNCEGKALIITAAEAITVRNLTLQGSRNDEANGGGIRDEAPNLTVDHVRFVRNETGVLAAPTTGSLTIRDSAFIGNGRCDQACSHAVYTNRIDRLLIERSTFRDTRQAHHVKSKALSTTISGSDFADGATGTASYAIEVPNGGSLTVTGSTFEKGPRADNKRYEIVIGSEGVLQPTHELRFRDNAFRNETGGETVFVHNMTATPASLVNTRILGDGPVVLLVGDGTPGP